MLLANIVLSYIAWMVYTVLNYSRVKNTVLYLAFPLALYVLPLIYYSYLDGIVFLCIATSVLLYSIIVFVEKLRRNIYIVVTTPIPIVLSLVYYTLVK